VGTPARGTLRLGPLGGDVTFPGPPLPLWGLALLALAIAVAGVGELLRGLAARRVPLLRITDPIERALLDLYVGGAAFYVLAAVPLPIFYPATIVAVLVASAIELIVLRLRDPDREATRDKFARAVASLGRPSHALALIVTAVLFLVELSAIDGIGSGNTFDASLLSTYTSLLLSHHTLPLTLAPVASEGLAYPQGTTVWLAVAQGLFDLPPLRTSLLITPLFLALAPLGAFGLGRRLGGTATAGAALAIVFALFSASTRGLVAGSNDFVLATPLVLLLAGWSVEWTRSGGVSALDALAFGALAGYGAALNPVGPMVLLLSLPILATLATPRLGGSLARWLSRWTIAIAASLLLVAPSLVAIARSPSSAGLPSSGGGTAVGSAAGESFSQFIGRVDPFLFRTADESLSPFPLLRAELALLLVGGIVLFVFGRKRSGISGDLARFALAAGATTMILLAGGVLAFEGIGPFPYLYRFTSVGELSLLLFVLYGIVAAVPLAAALRGLADGLPRRRSPSIPRPRAERWELGRIALPALVALAIVVPGIAVTSTELPGQLHSVYTTFSNVTDADLDLLEWAPGHLPPGSRVLVAPGSIAEFLPAYDPLVVLLYPMTVGFLTVHADYWVVVHELTNGTLDAAGWTALRGLAVEFLAVTESNTALFAPMDPAPLIAAQTPTAFQEGAVYLFDLRAP
jgi:hypothetical protein